MSEKSVKLPEFIEDSPQAWWLTCESVFEVKKVVKDIDKYNHFIAALPATVTRKLLDVLTYKGEDTEKLSLLKQRLMEMYAPTEDDCFTRIMAMPMLQPGQKPTQMFANMRALLPHDIEDSVDSSFFMRMHFLSRLPENIKSLVYSQGFKSTSRMAAFADSVVLSKGKSSLPIQAASFSWSQDVEEAEREAASAAPAVHAVQQTVTAVKKQTVKSSKRKAGMCYYHSKFGAKAEKCEGRGCYLSPPSTTAKLSGNS